MASTKTPDDEEAVSVGPGSALIASIPRTSTSLDQSDPRNASVTESLLIQSPPSSRSLSPAPLPRSLTWLSGLAIVLGLQIGSGIFSTPSAVIHLAGSPIVAISIWLLAGLLAWTGAASFIELGTKLPLNGGMQEYLRHCYSDTYGFIAAWSLVLLVKPCSIAMISLIFAEYLYRAFDSAREPSLWVLKGLALLAIASITFLNCLGVRVSTGTAKFFLVTKLAGLGSIIIIGLTHGIHCLSSQGRPVSGQAAESTCFPTSLNDLSEQPGKSFWQYTGTFTDATITALWAYSGWESLSIVTGELKDPSRNISRVLHSAMALVISLFVLANGAYLSVLPMDALKNTDTIALDFGRKLFGLSGALFYTWVVCLSCLGALNVKIFTAGRLTQAAVRRRWFPSILAAPEKETIPTRAMLINSGLATLYAMIGNFRGLTIFAGMAEAIILSATVAGVVVLRFRSHLDAHDARPSFYHTLITNPLIFCVGSIIATFYVCGYTAYKWRSWSGQ